MKYSSGRKYVGSYTVTATAKNGDKIVKTFTIAPKGTSIRSLSARSKGIKVIWKKQTSQTSGYQIQYSKSSKFTSAKTVTIKGNKYMSKTISKLSAKKKYYVRVRTYKTVNGKKYYSSWSSKKKVTTKR